MPPPHEAAITCPKPSLEIYNAVKKEAGKTLKLELIERKKKVHDGLMAIAHEEVDDKQDDNKDKKDGSS